MSHLYVISTGKWYYPAGEFAGNGYSGHGPGLNNPEMQNVANEGPLPVGFYFIAPPEDHPHLGPICMALKPFTHNQMYGRSGFFLHADEKDNPGKFLASDGCIVLNHDTRASIAQHEDRVVRVMAQPAPVNVDGEISV